MPPDGSTHKGCSLGIHFFHGEQVMDAAMKRGHISSENGDLSNTVSHQSENEWSDANEEEDDGQLLDAPMDDSKLVGPSKLITVETGRLSIELVASFMKDESVSFKATLFNPIWQRLKVQGLDLNWKYEKCTGAVSLSRNWCYVPPSSDLGSKGYKGSDFFVKEEDVVLQVLQDAITLLDLSPLVTKYATSISPFMAVLTRAVQDEMVRCVLSAFDFKRSCSSIFFIFRITKMHVLEKAPRLDQGGKQPHCSMMPKKRTKHLRSAPPRHQNGHVLLPLQANEKFPTAPHFPVE